MKKSLLSFCLIASVISMAATEGHITYTFKGDSSAKPETFIETEVKVKDTGLSFGDKFRVKGFKKKANFLNHSKVFVKYELPETNGINASIKTTLKPKFVKDDEFCFHGLAKLSGKLSYKHNDLTMGIHSKNKFHLGKDKEITSTNKLFIESDNGSKASIEVKSESKKPIDSVEGKMTIKRDNMKVNAGFKVNVSEFNEYYDDFIKEDSDHDVIISGIKLNDYLDNFHSEWIRQVKGLHREYVNVKLYNKTKNLKLSATPFIDYTKGYANESDSGYLLFYGTSLSAKYTLLDDKLTLKGKCLLSSIRSVKDQKIVNRGIYALNLYAKYDYTPNPKLDISPELEIDSAILTNDFTKKKSIFSTIYNKTTVSYSATDKLTLKGILKLKAKFLNTNTFVVKPTLSFEYDPLDSLKLDGKISFKNFSTFKTEFNMNYTWN